MNTYDAFHVAAMHGFLLLFLVLVGLLVLAGCAVGALWLYDRWMRRFADDSPRMAGEIDGQTPAAQKRGTGHAFTRHRRIL